MYNKWTLRCDKSPETKQAALYRKSFFRFQTFTTDKSPDKILPFLRLLMIIRMRNLFALARRNINLSPDCPNHEQGSDSFELIRLLSSDGLVGEFPVEKKPISDYCCFCHKTTTKTNKQTNKQRVIATTTRLKCCRTIRFTLPLSYSSVILFMFFSRNQRLVKQIKCSWKRLVVID